MILSALALIVAPTKDLTSITDEEFCAVLKNGVAKASDNDFNVDCQSRTFEISVSETLKDKNPAKHTEDLKRYSWRLVCARPGPGVTEFNRRGWHYKVVATYSDGTSLTDIPDCTAGPPQ